MVALRDIPPEGWHRTIALTDDWAKATVADEPLAWQPAGLNVEMSLFLTERDVIAHGKLGGTLTAMCARCTGPATTRIFAPFDLTFVPAALGRDNEDGKTPEREMLPGEAEVASYVDEAVDLEPTLREQIILALPYAPLCRHDCKGLCARCGHELNEGPCSCPPEVDEPEVKPDRWAALRDIKL